VHRLVDTQSTVAKAEATIAALQAKSGALANNAQAYASVQATIARAQQLLQQTRLDLAELAAQVPEGVEWDAGGRIVRGPAPRSGGGGGAGSSSNARSSSGGGASSSSSSYRDGRLVGVGGSSGAGVRGVGAHAAAGSGGGLNGHAANGGGSNGHAGGAGSGSAGFQLGGSSGVFVQVEVASGRSRRTASVEADGSGGAVHPKGRPRGSSLDGSSSNGVH
jgi:hypothetical protein